MDAIASSATVSLIDHKNGRPSQVSQSRIISEKSDFKKVFKLEYVENRSKESPHKS